MAIARSYTPSPSEASYFPALRIEPDSLVACSEKFGGVGTLNVTSSIGKYSAHGSPPPRDISPGLCRYAAAAFKLEGFLALLSSVR
jgi:hypothetical protein